MLQDRFKLQFLLKQFDFLLLFFNIVLYIVDIPFLTSIAEHGWPV